MRVKIQLFVLTPILQIFFIFCSRYVMLGINSDFSMVAIMNPMKKCAYLVSGADNHSHLGVTDLHLLSDRADNRPADHRVPIRGHVHRQRDDLLRTVRALQVAHPVHG